MERGLNMATVRQTADDIMIREVADRYIRDGYSVNIDPSPEELPEFLRGYRPDLIVTTPNEKIVVEVKTPHKTRLADYFESLTRLLEDQPGWKLELVINNRRNEELQLSEIPTYSNEELEVRLATAQSLAERGLLDSALLLAWSVLEGKLWKLSRDLGLILPVQGAAPLLSNLVSNGVVSQNAYQLLSDSLRARNRAAHGFTTDDLNADTVSTTVKYAEDLLKGQNI
jgi:hypothetical protein